MICLQCQANKDEREEEKNQLFHLSHSSSDTCENWNYGYFFAACTRSLLSRVSHNRTQHSRHVRRWKKGLKTFFFGFCSSPWGTILDAINHIKCKFERFQSMILADLLLCCCLYVWRCYVCLHEILFTCRISFRPRLVAAKNVSFFFSFFFKSDAVLFLRFPRFPWLKIPSWRIWWAEVSRVRKNRTFGKVEIHSAFSLTLMMEFSVWAHEHHSWELFIQKIREKTRQIACQQPNNSTNFNFFLLYDFWNQLKRWKCCLRMAYLLTVKFHEFISPTLFCLLPQIRDIVRFCHFRH